MDTKWQFLYLDHLGASCVDYALTADAVLSRLQQLTRRGCLVRMLRNGQVVGGGFLGEWRGSRAAATVAG